MAEFKIPKKSKVGRPCKGRTGLPQVDIINAIEYTKKAHESIGMTLKSFSGMAQAMGISEAFAKRAFGELKDYGLIEQENFGWRITDLGRRVVLGDKTAMTEVLLKNDIIQDLWNNFKDKTVSKDYLQDYIKKKRYRYKINAEHVADRFLETMTYIKKFEILQDIKSKPKEEQNIEFSKLIQLKYALTPPKQEEIKKLALEVSNELSDSEERSVRILAGKIKQNLDNPESLRVIVNSIVDIMFNTAFENLLPKPKESEERQKIPKTEEK